MSEVSVINQGGEEEAQQQLNLPPGFRFHPTDLEIVHHYLTRKVLDRHFSSPVIADVNLNKCEPWDLPGKAKMGEKEWYFFWHKDRKYPTGTRTNRATASGYWKATGKDKEVFRGRGVLVGMKKTLVFYLGRAPNGEKTPWVMHEYRLEGKLPPNLPRGANKDEWAVCRVFNKDLLAAKDGQPAASSTTAGGDGMERNNASSFDDFLLDGFFDTTELPALMDSPFEDDDLLDFTGAAVVGTTSSSSGAVAGTSSSSGYQVKTEQQPAAQNLQLDPYSYFSLPPLLPATNDNNYVPTAAQAAARGEQPSAIRRPDKAPALPDADAVWKSSPFPELDDLLCADNDFMDYSSMWKV